jgi:hypothetical protein
VRRDDVDFSAAVPYAHEAMDKRLRDWARWCRPRKGSQVHVMWRQYVASQVFQGAASTMPLDTLDAVKIEKAVHALPDAHSFAVQWSYVFGGNPRRAAQHVGETLAGLAQLVNDGRQMLINRRV